MIQDGIEKIILGKTSLTELERVIELPYEIASAIKVEDPESKKEASDDDFLSHIVTD